MQRYDGVTPGAWKRGAAMAAKYGVTITTDAGRATARGFTIAWAYDPAAGTFSIQCEDSPWWAPSALIDARIRAAVEACLDNGGTETTPPAGV
jgi:hypothetical protein